MAEEKISRRQLERAWIEHYLTDADGDPVMAAKLTGYSAPHRTGPSLLRKYQGQMSELQAKLSERLKMGPGEVLEQMTKIARDDEHKDQMKALESLGKVHGIFQADVRLNVDRASMVAEIHALIKTLAELGGTQALPPIVQVPSARQIVAAKVKGTAV